MTKFYGMEILVVDVKLQKCVLCQIHFVPVLLFCGVVRPVKYITKPFKIQKSFKLYLLCISHFCHLFRMSQSSVGPRRSTRKRKRPTLDDDSTDRPERVDKQKKQMSRQVAPVEVVEDVSP